MKQKMKKDIKNKYYKLNQTINKISQRDILLNIGHVLDNFFF